MTQALAPGAVHVWLAYADDIAPELMASYGALLTPVELEREAGFRFARDRELFRLTRAVQRVVLSAYVDIRPDAWRFRIDERGRPWIDAPVVDAPVFNLSNTHGLVACAVSHAEVGVDVEEVESRPAPLEVARDYFSPRELAGLRALAPERQPRRFYDLWTLKEAYLKARGMGLGIPLDRFSFDPDPVPSFVVDPELGDRAADWSFARLSLRPGFQGAVGARLEAGLALEVFELVPLAGVRQLVAAGSG